MMLRGDPDAAIARMKKRYDKIVGDEWTTLPELWAAGSHLTGNSLSSTHNHAWSGGPLTILSQYFAGLAPVEPGWASYQVRPQMGSLRNIKATVDGASGKISVEVRRDERSSSLKLDSPNGTTAEVYLPCGKSGPKVVTANGRVVWKDGRAERVEGVEFKEVSDGWVHLEVAPGDWKFRTKL